MEIHWICDLFDHLSLNTDTQNSTSMFSIEMFSLCSLFDGLSISGIQVGAHILQKFGDSESSGGLTTTGKDFRTANSFQVVNGGISDELGLRQVNYFDCFFILLLFIKTSENRISTRQVKLDLYLFYRENCGINPKMTKSSSCLILRNGLTTGTWFKEISHQIMLDYYLFCYNWIGILWLGFIGDVGQRLICLEGYFSWNHFKEYLDNDLPFYLVFQLKHLDLYIGVHITLLLDMPRRQTFKSGLTRNGVWAVSLYIWYNCGLHSVDDLKGIVWMFEGYSVCSWQVFDSSFTKLFFSNQLDPFSNVVVYWVVSCFLVEYILTSRPRSPSSLVRAWEVFLYMRNCVCEWIISAIGKEIKILLFGGSWYSLVSHPSPSSDEEIDAPIICEARCRKHIHVLKGSPMVVPVPHDRSGSDEGRAVSYVSSLVLDRLSNNFMSSWRHSLARHLIRLYKYYLNYCNFLFLVFIFFVLVRPPG